MQYFEDYLRCLYPKNPNYVQEAELYSLLAGGKRLRPNILFRTLECYGVSSNIGLDIAASIEMIHTYSLIHDDLPAMDDDDYRRGRPSCHKKYGEAIAILAGDGLLTRAFETALRYDGPNCKEIITEIAVAAGDMGMIFGQLEDLTYENSKVISLETLDNIHLHKTGCLFSLPLVVGGLIAEKNDIDSLRIVGKKIGLAFQVQDDILDVTSTDLELGKSISDVKNAKATYVTVLGIDKANEMASQLYNEATILLKSLDLNPKPLLELFDSMVTRKN